MHTTVIIVESAHTPTNYELRKTVVAAMEEGKRQGFEPIRAKGIAEYENFSEVVDRDEYDKWIQV